MNAFRKYFTSSDKRSRFARRKPVVLKVWQYQGENSLAMAPEWVRSYEYRVGSDFAIIEITKPTSPVDESAQNGAFYKLGIPTMEGIMQASAGDWLIRGVRGEIWACKPEIFAETYELLDTADGEPRQPRPIDPINGLNDDPVRLARARNMTFEGIDPSKVKRDLRHSIVDRRVLLAEIDRLKDVIAEKDQRLIELNDEKRRLNKYTDRLQKVLAFWLPRGEASNGLLVAKRAEAAALIPKEALERECADDLDWVTLGKNARYEISISEAANEAAPAAERAALAAEGQPVETSSEVAAEHKEFEELGALMTEAACTLRSMEKRARERNQYIEQLEAICASAYQMAGAYEAPVRFLDALALHDEYLDMTPEEIIEKLLPVETPQANS
jgi:hypothetical protein